MLPKNIDLRLTRGDTAYLWITITGAIPEEVSFSIKRRYSDAQYVAHKSLTDGITLDDGKYVVRIAPEDTANLPATRYCYDVELIINGDVITPILGTLDLTPDVTNTGFTSAEREYSYQAATTDNVLLDITVDITQEPPEGISFAVLKGDKGDKGDKGERGEQGIQGEKGDKGDTGAKGDKGDRGEQGETGPQGIQGEQGPQGIQGPKGDKGDKGDQGIQGIQGEQGEKGEKGDKGDKGDTGEDGYTPVRGTDYWTSEDKAEIIEDVTEEFSDNLDGKADVIIRSASGDIVNITDGADNAPIERLTVGIEPVQDLHGYDSPWPAGGGVNLVPAIPQIKTQNGVTFTVNADGTLTVNGTATARAYIYIVMYTNFLQNGEYTISTSGIPTTPDISRAFINLAYSDDGSVYAGTYGTLTGDGSKTFTVSHQYSSVLFDVPAGNVFNNNIVKVQIEKGSSATSWSPYSNVCPISGWTGARVTRTGADPESGETYDISWETEGTVYGGRLDVTTGELVVDRASVIFDGTQTVKFANWKSLTNTAAWLYDPSATPGINNVTLTNLNLYNLISDSLPTVEYAGGNGVYGKDAPCISLVGSDAYGLAIRVNDTSLTTAEAINAYLSEHPIQIVYELAEPITYHLTEIQIKTLLGENHIWADCGAVDIEYHSDTKKYIDEAISERYGEIATLRESIAPVENGNTASKAYAAGAYFIRNGSFCKALVAIASGAQFTLNTNYATTTIAAELFAALNA